MEKIKTTLIRQHLFYAPLLNWVVIGVFALMILRLMWIFTDSVAANPLVIMSISNILLYGLSDAIAQTVIAIKEHRASSRRNNSLGIHNNEKPISDGSPFARSGSNVFTVNNTTNVAAFRFDRLIRFATWGFLLSTVQFKWLELLEKWIPITYDSIVLPVLTRVLCDQLIFTPICLACFFAFMTFVEGGGRKLLVRKLGSLYVPTLKSNFMVWPAAQIINFRLVPLHFQLPFAATIGIFWNTWLSLANCSSTEA
ncbi:hypothetical protein V1511DRAFT_463408 [Dipodascopsis uninucleata]